MFFKVQLSYTIWRNSNSYLGFLLSEWYRNHAETCSEGHSLTPWGRENTFLPKTNLFKAKYAKPFWETLFDLLYRVHLKHQNWILIFSKVWKKRSRFWKNTSSLFRWCCPAGGLDLRNSRFPILLMLPCGRPRCWKIEFSSIYLIFLTLQTSLICLDLSFGSMLERLVSKNGIECSSQCLKWASRARVMITVHALFAVSQWASEWVSQWASELVCQEASEPVSRWASEPVSRCVAKLVTRWAGQPTTW